MVIIDFIKRERRALVIALVSGFTLPLLVCSSCMNSVRNYIIIATFNLCIWLSMYYGNTYLNKKVDKKIAWTKEPFKRILAGIAIIIVYPAPVVWAITKVYEITFDLNLGSLYRIINFSIVMTFIITFILTSRSFLRNWRQVAIDAERLERENIESRYESLRNQVNPHFLFNSLNALSNLVYEDQDKAVRFIKQLSDVYRYVLDTRERDVVDLEEELRVLRSYIYLQQIRSGDKLRIDIQLNDVKTVVVPLALQMLFENAIKHNIVSEEDPLDVKLYADEHYLVLENTLQRKMVIAEESSGIGLDNIRRRYALLTDRAVEVSEANHKFTVKLPRLSQL